MSNDLSKLYEGCRSYRRFQQKAIPSELLHEIAETARTRSSAMNQQKLRYITVSAPSLMEQIQPFLHWAARLPKEIGTPKASEQPVACILVLAPEKTTPLMDIDTGIALDTMAITAWSHGIGSCILKAIDRDKIVAVVSTCKEHAIPEGYTISAVLALGYPANTSTLVAPDEEHGLGYYVDSQRNYYVPKLPSEQVIRYFE